MSEANPGFPFTIHTSTKRKALRELFAAPSDNGSEDTAKRREALHRIAKRSSPSLFHIGDNSSLIAAGTSPSEYLAREQLLGHALLAASLMYEPAQHRLVATVDRIEPHSPHDAIQHQLADSAFALLTRLSLVSQTPDIMLYRPADSMLDESLALAMGRRYGASAATLYRASHFIAWLPYGSEPTPRGAPPIRHL